MGTDHQMKFWRFFWLAMSLVSSTGAFAYSGGNSLSCKSQHTRNAFSLVRSNSPGWTAPSFSLTIRGKTYTIATQDDSKSWGETIHNAPMGLIYVTANNLEEKGAENRISITVQAIPRTVKAYDHNGRQIKWSLKDEQSESGCYDSNGKATFKALIGGSYLLEDEGGSLKSVEPILMDCVLTYNSGMAC